MDAEYLWKSKSQATRVAEARYAHGDELSEIPGVVGLGMGKENIILYVSDESVAVPDQIDGVPIVKVVRH